MSGPIVRRYGFPNFEKIFGDRPPAHGQDGPPADEIPSPDGPGPAEPGPADVPTADGPTATDRETGQAGVP